MTSTRFLRTVAAGCTLALLAAEPARALMPVMPEPKKGGKGLEHVPYHDVVLGPLASQHIGSAQNALLTMARQLDEIATVKSDTDRSAVVAAWGTIVQTQRDLWSTEMQAAIEAGKLHMKQKGKVDAALIASLNAQVGAQLNFFNSAFGTGGGMLAEWKLDFNQRMANMAAMEKTMPVILKQLTTDMDQVHQRLKDIQLGLDHKETSPSTAEGMMKGMDALKTRIGRVSSVVGIRQKVIEPYVKASAYPELKKKLDPILNLINPEQVAQNPNLSSIPAEVIQILQGWKSVLPKKCEDTYGPVWGSAKKAIEWVSDHKKLWQSLPFFKEATTFEAADGLLARAKAAARERLSAIRARWNLLDDIKDFKKRALEGRRLAEEMRARAATDEPVRTLLDLARKIKDAAEKAEKAGSVFPEAKKFTEQQTLLVREYVALLAANADAHHSPDGREFDDLMSKVAKAPTPEDARAIWTDFRTKWREKTQECGNFRQDNWDDIHKLIDEGKVLLPLMQ